MAKKAKRKVAKYKAPEDGFTAFPVEVLEQTDAEELSLYRVFDYRKTITIPDAIAKMTRLQRFAIGGAKVVALPEAIGKLTKLEELSLDYAEDLKTLPKSLGNLKALRELTMSYSTKLKELPESIGKLTKLEMLTTEPGGLKSVPASLWNATSLKTLTLADGVRKLPPGIGKLKNLETLALHPAALASIAKELKDLTSLKTLRVWGKAKSVPAEVGDIPNLEDLALLYMEDVKTLPATFTKLTKLKRLDVSGNALTEMQWLVRALPMLKELDVSENKLPLKERRAVEALMRLPPKKRVQAKPDTKPVAIAKPTYLGDVASVNAYLATLFVDANDAPAWRGVGDDSKGSDWERFNEVVGDKLGAPVSVGKARGIGVAMAIGQGVGRIFRTTHGIVLVESFIEDEKDPIFLEYVAGAPEKAKAIGKLDVMSGAIAVTPSTDGCEDVTKKLAKLKGDKAIECGSESSSLLVPMPKGTYEVLVEREVERSWGSGQRTIVRPLA